MSSTIPHNAERAVQDRGQSATRKANTYPNSSVFARSYDEHTYIYGPMLEFEGCVFGDHCKFEGCKFKGCTFGKHCHFGTCIFGNDCQLEYGTFNDCKFGLSAFFQGCYFTLCEFKRAKFNDCEFDGCSDMSGCQFEDSTFKPYTSLGTHNHFKDCLFYPCVSFGWGCSYEGTNHGLIDLLAAEHNRIGELLAAERDRLFGTSKVSV